MQARCRDATRECRLELLFEKPDTVIENTLFLIGFAASRIHPMNVNERHDYCPINPTVPRKYPLWLNCPTEYSFRVCRPLADERCDHSLGHDANPAGGRHSRAQLIRAPHPNSRSRAERLGGASPVAKHCVLDSGFSDVADHRYHLSRHSAYSIRITLLAKALPAGKAPQSRSAGRSSAAAGMNSALVRKASRLVMKHVVNHS